jgi:glucoamylase
LTIGSSDHADDFRSAFGSPGIPARWTSSAKSAVGTALTATSRVWFTLSHGILNEIYYPRIDQACTRDFGLIVTDGRGFFSEEKRHATSTHVPFAAGVPAFSVTSRCAGDRYRIEKLVFADPRRDVVLQHVRFHALREPLANFHLYALLAPHLVNRGAGNTAWLGDYKGTPLLFAEGRGTALALGCSAPFLARSVGFVGFSDGWQDLSRHFELRWRYDIARDGNVALTGEVDLQACGGSFVLALGFGRTATEAALRVRASLSQGADDALAEYVSTWRSWQSSLAPLDADIPRERANTYRISTAVLRTHEARSFTGGYIASLSIPWGFSKGDEDLGGYHLVWPRDLVETAGGLLAAGAKTEVREIVYYLRAIQEADGHWAQNSWLDGTPYWHGVQMDECALPILLVDLAWREGALREAELRGLWPMVKRAAEFIVSNGPVTRQDRWEEAGGYSPFTLAAEIAALLAAADCADRFASPEHATYLRETADIWNGLIEHWIYATGTPLAKQVGVDGYYVRVAEPDLADAASPLGGFVPIKNRPPDSAPQSASQMVSPDALALVRFGLRAANDPRIRNTVRVIDALLKVELPAGPCWRRYNGDGYGEHDDGRPFDGTGTGRPWPLLTGERAHYELEAGNRAAAETLLAAFEGFASDGHLIPEQVWDAADIPSRGLARGRPSGSAMPLVWAHAEHVKLLRSLADGRVFDTPPQTRQRYQVDGVRARFCIWRFNQKCRSIAAGHVLRVEVLTAAIIHWSSDGWRGVHDTPTRDSGMGVHVADLDTAGLAAGREVVFTVRWLEANRWEGTDYRLTIV